MDDPAEKIPLVEVLEDLGATLLQSELPPTSQLPQIVGAIVKVLEHAGVEVADELWPEEPAPVQRPETGAVHQAQTNDRLDRLETLLEKLLGHHQAAASAPVDHPAASAPVDHPEAAPAPAEPLTSPPPTPAPAEPPAAAPDPAAEPTDHPTPAPAEPVDEYPAATPKPIQHEPGAPTP